MGGPFIGAGFDQPEPPPPVYDVWSSEICESSAYSSDFLMAFLIITLILNPHGSNSGGKSSIIKCRF